MCVGGVADKMITWLFIYMRKGRRGMTEQERGCVRDSGEKENETGRLWTMPVFCLIRNRLLSDRLFGLFPEGRIPDPRDTDAP